MAKSVMQHNFGRQPAVELPRSTLSRDHGRKTTFNSGDLIPCYVDEVLPGDTFILNMTSFARLATPIFPFMDNVFMDVQFWFVPNRLIWNNWEKFNGAQDDPGDSTDFTVPTVDSPGGGFLGDSLADHFGIPTLVDLTVNSLHFRAYNLIYNQWYRSEDLQDSVHVDLDDGPDTTTDYAILKRGKRPDYFTSCLPWPQKGDSVALPIGASAPITGLGYSTQGITAGPFDVYETDGTGSVVYDDRMAVGVYGQEDPDNLGFPNIRADLSSATAATVNQLRQAFQVQKLLERDARGGTRYVELLKSHFGVTSPDFRLQRAEFLGSASARLNVNPIAQTSQSDPAVSPQGNLAAIATSTLQGGFSKSFTEHGVLLGILSVRADLNYQQGLHRMWSRQTRYDFYWPVLSHLGEQAVLNQEIMAQGTSADTDVFGYQGRYDEYRHKNSEICGAFRTNYASGTLDSWHLAQNFATLPLLDATFIEENPPIQRVVAVQNEPEFLCDIFYSLRCVRPMPTDGIPGFIDHF